MLRGDRLLPFIPCWLHNTMRFQLIRKEKNWAHLETVWNPSRDSAFLARNCGLIGNASYIYIYIYIYTYIYTYICITRRTARYYEHKIKHGEQRFRYKLDEDASATLKNALLHQQRKAASATLAKDDNEPRSQRSGEDATAVQSHQSLPGEVTPGHDES